jgi:hypothetical protein
VPDFIHDQEVLDKYRLIAGSERIRYLESEDIVILSQVPLHWSWKRLEFLSANGLCWPSHWLKIRENDEVLSLVVI